MKFSKFITILTILSRQVVHAFIPFNVRSGIIRNGFINTVTHMSATDPQLSTKEYIVLSTVRSQDSSVQECLSAIDSLDPHNTMSSHLLEELRGTWKVEWTDLGKSRFAQTITRIIKPNLKMLSFGTLPSVKVDLAGSYQIIHDDNTYDLIQVFHDGFAMRLRGPSNLSEESSSRIYVQFKSVQLLDLLNIEKSAIESMELDTNELAISKSRSTHIDILYLSENMRVHKGASGSTYVLTRYPTVDLPWQNDIIVSP